MSIWRGPKSLWFETVSVQKAGNERFGSRWLSYEAGARNCTLVWKMLFGIVATWGELGESNA